MAQFRIDEHVLHRSHNRTLYEVGMMSDRLTPSGTLTDAFGKLRTSSGFTLFDSTHRYQDNGKWATKTNGTSNTEHKPNESVVNLNVDSANGSYVYRETKRVLSYQPGKSLLIMNTFVMNTPKAGLTQRVGYFNTENGVFLENDGIGNYLVLRSNDTGTPTDIRIAQSNWNIDKFDGTGYSSQILGTEHSSGVDTTKSNIFWIDIEWLGVGDVRCGFVIDGRMMTAHVFHNDNKNTTTYMTTATLPCRYEIVNTTATSGNSTLKQICSTVISEGGYELQGRSRAISIPIASPKDLPTSGTFTPVISIRLKDSFKDSVVTLKDVEFFGVTNNTSYRYKIIIGGTLDANASWQSADSDSPIEYDFSSTAITGGRDAIAGYINVSAGAGGSTINLSREMLFAYQLERDPFVANNHGTVITLAATGAANGNDGVGAMAWEEIT
jgi:hypothetical protein